MKVADEDRLGAGANRRKRNRVLPDFCDFVSRLADDLHGADGAAVDDDRHLVAFDRRADQHGAPRPSSGTAVVPPRLPALIRYPPSCRGAPPPAPTAPVAPL